MIKKVILVFKTHFDIGFTDLSEKVLEKYAGPMLDDVLDVCQKTEDQGKLHYVWTLPAWPLTYILNVCRGEKKERLEHFIRNGQITWHALAFTSHTDFCGEEEYLESLRYGKKLAETYGRPYPLAAKMTDVPGHGFMLPEILAGNGVRFLHLGANRFSAPPQVPGLFWWETPSGKRLLTMYHPGGYGSGLKAPGDWPFPVWLALMPTSDNLGPDDPEIIQKYAEQAQKLYPGAEVMCGTMDDFLLEMEKCDLSKVPVINKDLADTWIHGVESYPAESAKIRQARRQMRALQLGLADADSTVWESIRGDLDDYYQAAHLYGEHTWGADVKTWLDPEGRPYDQKDFLAFRSQKPGYRFIEKSWNEQRSRAQECLKDIAAIESKTGLKVESLPHETGRLTVASSRKAVSSKRYRLTFDEKTGTIHKLEDLKLKRTLLKSRKGQSVFGYRYTRVGNWQINEFLRSYGYMLLDWGIRDFGKFGYPDCETVSLEAGFSSWTVDKDTIRFEYFLDRDADAGLYGNAESAILEVKLPDDEEEPVDVRLTLKGKQASPYAESGTFELPLAKKLDRYQTEKNGFVLDPEKDIEDGANHCFYPIEDYAAALDESAGVMVMPLDSALMSIGQDRTFQYHTQFQKSDNVFCFNLFNNMWGTNFPQWIEGDLVYRFRIMGFDNKEKDHLFEKAASLCEGSLSAGKTNDLPDFGPGIQILGIHHEPDGFRISVRNLTEKTGHQKAHWDGYKLCQTDYYGREAEDQKKADNGDCTFMKHPYGLYLFRAEKI